MVKLATPGFKPVFSVVVLAKLEQLLRILMHGLPAQ